jgi:hypothetical protein
MIIAENFGQIPNCEETQKTYLRREDWIYISIIDFVKKPKS